MSEMVPKSGFRKKTILIVEDNHNVLRSFGETARTLGFEVATASSRNEATALIDLQAFDVALVDKVLVEGDSRNRDGIAILRYLHDKNEGTKSILLTGQGVFADATEAAFDLHAFWAIEKGDPEMQEKMRRILIKAANSEPNDKYQSSVRVWCGTDDPVEWGTRMSGLLRPSGGIKVLNSLLDDLAKTLHPMLRRETDNGIQNTSIPSVVAGLYWSRGVGSTVIVVICRGDLPSTIPMSKQWPEELRLSEPPLYRVNRKNLTGAVFKCEGLDNTEFGVASAYPRN